MAQLLGRSVVLCGLMAGAAGEPAGRSLRGAERPGARPTALALFDVDFTLFGVASSHIGARAPLYAGPFWDDAYDAPGKEGYGDIWGLGRGLVPNVSSFKEHNTLGPDSILSTAHPLFGQDSPLDMWFGIVSDGSSLVQYAFSQDGHPVNNTAQIEAVRALRGARDFNPRWHILDNSLYSCFGKYDNETGESWEGWRLNPVQQHCTTWGHKDIMVQNVLDFYADFGVAKFESIFFADDQMSNLQCVKNASHLNGSYTFGAPLRPREHISTDSVWLAYPSGGTAYEVRPRGDGGDPMNCGGCYYVTAAGEQVPPFEGNGTEGDVADDWSAFQALVAGFGWDNYYGQISANGTLSGAGRPLSGFGGQAWR